MQTPIQFQFTEFSFPALSASGNTTACDFGAAIPTNHTYTVAVTGSPTSISVQPMGSVDGANFVNLGSAQTAAGLFTISDTPLAALQFAVTIAGGTSPTVTIASLSR